MNKAAKYILIGAAAVFVLAAAMMVAWFRPESPQRIVHRGSFDIYEFHYPGLGEPGHSRQELWYHDKRLAQYPGDMWFNASEDQVIFVNAKDAPPDAPAPEGNGIYYFDARSEKQHLVVSGKYPKLLLNESRGDRTGSSINTNPFSMNGKWVVVSFGDGAKLPELVFKKQSALIVDLDSGEIRNAAQLLGVGESENIFFLGWSLDNSMMFFKVSNEERALPVSLIRK